MFPSGRVTPGAQRRHSPMEHPVFGQRAQSVGRSDAAAPRSAGGNLCPATASAREASAFGRVHLCLFQTRRRHLFARRDQAFSCRTLGGGVTVDDLSHLQPPFQEAARLSNAERIHWLRQERWIQYPRAERILERLIDLVDYPPHDRMPCLVIYGATGMGKTRIIQKFLRENRTHFDRKLGKTRLLVVSIQMPPAPSERDLYEEILAAMGGIFTYGTSVTALRHRIRSLARQLEVRMLVIDEIHSLLAGTFREQRIFLNAIRFLANDLRLPLVCAGTHEAKQALMTDQQLADRFEAAELPAWANDSNFQQLLLSFGSILPLRLPS